MCRFSQLPLSLASRDFVCVRKSHAERRKRRKKEEGRPLTVGVPHVGEELHGRRRERVVLGEAQLGGEDAALKGCALGALDEALPVQQVVLGDGAGGDALGGVVGEGAVLLEEAAVGGGLGHGGCDVRLARGAGGGGRCLRLSLPLYPFRAALVEYTGAGD